MGERIHILGSAFNMIGGLLGVLGWLPRFARLMLVPKSSVAPNTGSQRTRSSGTSRGRSILRARGSWGDIGRGAGDEEDEGTRT